MKADLDTVEFECFIAWTTIFVPEPHRMAPPLVQSKLVLIHDMIKGDQSLTNAQLAEAANCSK